MSPLGSRSGPAGIRTQEPFDYQSNALSRLSYKPIGENSLLPYILVAAQFYKTGWRGLKSRPRLRLVHFFLSVNALNASSISTGVRMMILLDGSELMSLIVCSVRKCNAPGVVPIVLAA